MTQEEKARAYDEALKRAKEINNEQRAQPFDVMTKVFHELKEESEDELKWLTEFIEEEGYYLSMDIRDDEDRIKLKKLQKSLAWLEKQKEPELSEDLGKYIAELSKQFPEVSFAKLSRIAVRVKNWLEKQGKETSWKPSKEEMDVLYGLAYITNQYDEHKEEVIVRLYQDLKREFFNGSSYENMFPTNTNIEDDVRRRSTIQVLEYARSLDTYNQYGKADIDKNIAWLEKQGEQKPVDKVEPKFKVGDLIRLKDGDGLEWTIKEIHHDGYYTIVCEDRDDFIYLDDRWELVGKLADNAEPKFKVGDWVIRSIKNEKRIGTVTEILPEHYIINFDGWREQIPIIYGDCIDIRLWTIQDAKDGDVLVASDESVFIYSGSTNTYAQFYIALTKYGDFNTKGGNWEDKNCVKPATKEQRDTLMKAMADAGYTFDFGKKELKKIEKKSQRMVSAEAKEALYDKPTDEEMKELLRTEYEKGRADTIAEIEKDWSEEDEKTLNEIFSVAARASLRKSTLFGKSYDYIKWQNWLKSLRDRVQPQPKQEWSEEDEKRINRIIIYLESANVIDTDILDDDVDWLKSLKQRIGG